MGGSSSTRRHVAGGKKPAKDDPARGYIRRWARKNVHLPADVEILTADGKRFTRGSAIVRDVSLRGARLGRIVLAKKCLPARSFKLKIFFNLVRYRGIGAICRPIRFGRGPEFELAVEFENFWVATDKR